METRASYFCVDIECNGPVPGLYAMVSLGAVAVIPDAAGTLAPGPSLYLEFRPEAPRFDPEAAAIHGLDLARLAREGLPLAEGCRQLADWVRATTRPGTRPVFVGHNAPFDWSFVAWAYASLDMDNPFGYKAFCTKSLAAGVLGLHWFDTGKETLAARLALPAEDRDRKHRADYDAHYQALVLVGLLERLTATAPAAGRE